MERRSFVEEMSKFWTDTFVLKVVTAAVAASAVACMLFYR